MDKAQTIDFLLIPEFSMFALVSTLEPLRVANRFGGDLYRWRLLGLKKGAVRASNQIDLCAEQGFQDVDDVRFLIICASFNPKHYLSLPLRRWLRGLHEAGATLGSIDTGIYFLSDAGLVGKEKTTLHWEQIPCFQEDFPDITISNELFETSPHRLYCSGGAAGTDMMLQKITNDHGPELAISVSEQFLLSRIRAQEENQRLQVSVRHNVHNKRLATAIMLMENHIENPLSIDDLAARACISRRQLERLFKDEINDTPRGFNLKLRLTRSRTLLRETALSITEISIATGFESVSYFSRTFRQVFGKTPSQIRGAI